jgi:BsuBI/PstI restriction endonuclease
MKMLPDLLDWDGIHKRLAEIFPVGTPHRNYCTRELAASTVFTALYVGAVEGSGIWFGPKHVYRMTDRQAERTDEPSRSRYASKIMGAGFQPSGKRWYSDNTREPIRDETLREGLVAVGAVVEKTDVPTTSSKPRLHSGLWLCGPVRSAVKRQGFRNRRCSMAGEFP